MTKRFPLVLFGLGSSLQILIFSASGQDRAPDPAPSPGEPIKMSTPSTSAPPVLPPLAPPSGPSLDQTLAQVGKVEEELARKVETLQDSIDREAKAKRVTEPLAQSLRWSLRNALNLTGSDFNTIVAYSRLPLENETLMEQLKALEADWMAAQAQRGVLLKTAADAARINLTYVLRTANKPADVDPLIASLDRLQELVPLRTTGASVSHGLSPIMMNYSTTFLRALRRVLDMPSEAEPTTIGPALTLLSNSSTSIRSIIGEDEMQRRIHRTVAPFQKAQDEAEESFAALLREGKPSAELAAALAKLELAAERNQQARSGVSQSGVRDLGGALTLYRKLCELAGALESGDFAAAHNSLKDAEDSRRQVLGAAAAATYAAQFAVWKKAIEDGHQKAVEKRRTEIQSRFAAIKQPADLAAFGAELAALERQDRTARDPDFPRGLAAQLNGLAALWESANPGLFSRQNYQESETSFAADLADLRRRIERDVLARVLTMPELKESPLAELPIDTALDRQTNELAKKEEWRSLLKFLDESTTLGRFESARPREIDLAAAVRAFLAGQNFELAEQWVDAVLSYKAVLRSASERAPIQQAANRLKALNKAHPEAFVSPGARGTVTP